MSEYEKILYSLLLSFHAFLCAEEMQQYVCECNSEDKEDVRWPGPLK